MPFPSQVSDRDTANVQNNPRPVDFTQNFVWWALLATPTGSGLRFFFSTDVGESWTLDSSMNLDSGTDTNNVQEGAFFIDKDDFMHVVYVVGGGTSGPRMRYRRGTPNAQRTSYTWSSFSIPYTALGSDGRLADGDMGYSALLDIVAFPDVTSGWQVFIAFNTGAVAGPTFTGRVVRCTVSSGGTFTGNVQAFSAGLTANAPTMNCMDFRHTAADEKAVQSATPSVYWAWQESDGTDNLMFIKIGSSGGVWSAGTRRDIDATTTTANSRPSLYYDGTRVVMTTTFTSSATVLRCFERDEADTTTTTRTVTALSDGVIRNWSIGYDASANIWAIAAADTSADLKKSTFDRGAGTWGAWSTVFTGTVDLGAAAYLSRSQQSGAMPVIFVDEGTTPDRILVDVLGPGIQFGEATMQAVATVTPDGNFVAGGDVVLRGVALVTSEGSFSAGGQVTFQGVARLLSEAEGIPFLDFTTYDAYIEAGGDVHGLIFFNEQQPQTVTRQLEPTRQNVGNNPDEIRPDFGNFFAQSDFSHGMGQRYFHQPGRDPKKAFYVEGFDISEPGRLSHLHALTEARDSTTIGVIAQVGDKVFVVNGQSVDRSDAFPGSWTAEDPSAADANQDVHDIAAEGARLFAAINTSTAGVRVRSAAGTWTRYQPDGATDLVVGTPTRVAWLKERLMVVGGTSSRSIYEVLASSAPVALETLPEGWTFQAIFEAGGFIHACAVNVDAGLSRVHHYALNTAGSALEKKSSTKFPQGQLIYTGDGFPGIAFVAGGVRNDAAGYDPILYRATMNDRGELDYAEIRQEEGASASDLSVRALTAMGEEILLGWSVGSGAFGGARDGIAVYHIARDAFAYHLKKTGAGTSKRIADVMPFKGQVLVAISGDGLYYEDLTAFATTATLVTSLADWNNAGQKVWDRIQVSHAPLGVGTSVKVEYGTEAQEDTSWTEVFTSSTLDSEGASGSVSNVKSRLFALRITSTATASVDQEFLGYAVRSLPAPDRNEFQLTRYIRLIASDQKDEDAQRVLQDPRTLLGLLQDALFSFVVFYESGFSWTAWLEDVSTFEPAQPMYETTLGEALKDVFYVQLKMTGAR